MEQIVQQQEAKLGDKHPRLGASCMVLCKLYLKVGGEEGIAKATQALNKAWDILTACQRDAGHRTNHETDQALHFLLNYVHSMSSTRPTSAI